MVSQVRRFNRIVTQRVGALDDRFLARDRPLGEARLLWEIGEDRCDVRELRARLDLDSGYLSRLLRSLEAARLVATEAGEGDRAVSAADVDHGAELAEVVRLQHVPVRPAGEVGHRVVEARESLWMRGAVLP